ncbi:flagellar protein [Fonticella tunisiensis]|uniref:Uncharacterized protein n=1 Tax=Fonticella tunisiensis TaxID=1096341 RepID=A0A4R7KAY3_9CLOT|nr:flagellar protein [Fonticella tunisiensis]TDT50590.1 hypothetical protein EDD71_1267 [Fonticella tunisiensis]
MGFGLGLIIATLLMLSYFPRNIPKYVIEKQARDLGMRYEDEIKAFFKNDTK